MVSQLTYSWTGLFRFYWASRFKCQYWQYGSNWSNRCYRSNRWAGIRWSHWSSRLHWIYWRYWRDWSKGRYWLVLTGAFCGVDFHWNPDMHATALCHCANLLYSSCICPSALYKWMIRSSICEIKYFGREVTGLSGVCRWPAVAISVWKGHGATVLLSYSKCPPPVSYQHPIDTRRLARTV